MDPVHLLGAVLSSQKYLGTETSVRARMKAEDRFYEEMAETPWLFDIVKSAFAHFKRLRTSIAAPQRRDTPSQLRLQRRSKAFH